MLEQKKKKLKNAMGSIARTKLRNTMDYKKKTGINAVGSPTRA